MIYYAVANGRDVGIYPTWAECEQQVKGFSGAKFKKFKLKHEAEKYITDAKQNPQPTTCKTKAVGISKCLGSRQYLAKKQGMACGMVVDENVGISLSMQQVFIKQEPSFLPDYIPLETQSDKLTIKKEIKQEDMDTSLWFQDNEGDQKLLLAMVALQESVEDDNRNIFKKKRNKRANGRGMNAYTSQTESNPIRIGRYTFTTDNQGYVDIYIGSHCENIGSWNCMAGYGVYFGDEHPLNTSKAANGRMTRNVGDVEAAIDAITTAKSVGIQKLCVHTDAEFLLNAVTSWIFDWKRSGWRNKSGKVIQNRKEFEKLDNLLAGDIDVKWHNTKGYRNADKAMYKAKQLAAVGTDKYLDEHPAKDIDGSCDFDFDIDDFY